MVVTEDHESRISLGRWKLFKQLSTPLDPLPKNPAAETNDDSPYRSNSCMFGTVIENNQDIQ